MTDADGDVKWDEPLLWAFGPRQLKNGFTAAYNILCSATGLRPVASRWQL